MNQRKLGTERAGPLTWRDRAVAVVGTVLAAGLAIGAATVGLVVGLIALVVMVPLVVLGVIWLRRLVRQTAAGGQHPSAGRGDLIEGEFEVLKEPPGPSRPRGGDRLSRGQAPGGTGPPS